MMRPIYFTRDEVATMVRTRCFFDPMFAQQIGETSERLDRIANGKQLPTAAVLRAFDLSKPYIAEAGYRWNL